MEFPAAQLEVAVQAELPGLSLDLAAEREGSERVRAGHARGQEAQHPAELGPAHVEGKLHARLRGADALEEAAELSLSASEVAHAELAQREVAALQRAGDAYFADRLSAPDQGVDAGVHIGVEAAERVRQGLWHGHPSQAADGVRGSRGRRHARRNRGRLRLMVRNIGVEIELVDREPRAESDAVPHRDGRGAGHMRGIEGDIERAHLDEAVVDLDAARDRGPPQAVGRHSLDRDAGPAHEVAEIVGVGSDRADEARRRRRGIEAAGERDVGAARQQRTEALDVELAAVERRLDPHLAHHALSPAHGVDIKVDRRL